MSVINWSIAAGLLWGVTVWSEGDRNWPLVPDAGSWSAPASAPSATVAMPEVVANPAATAKVGNAPTIPRPLRQDRLVTFDLSVVSEMVLASWRFVNHLIPAIYPIEEVVATASGASTTE